MRVAALSAVVLGAVLTAAIWWRRHPLACPYGQRFWVEAPHPLITRGRLIEALEPAGRSAVLEIGPGTGYYTAVVAKALHPSGTLHVFDVQQKMLDHVSGRLRAQGLTDVVATRGDAMRLPYGGGLFDAVYLVAVLGEIRDQDAALREIARVLRPGGRLVVGELFGDPHMVRAAVLRRRAMSAGLRFVRRIGPRFGYFAVFEKPLIR